MGWVPSLDTRYSLSTNSSNQNYLRRRKFTVSQPFFMSRPIKAVINQFTKREVLVEIVSPKGTWCK